MALGDLASAESLYLIRSTLFESGTFNPDPRRPLHEFSMYWGEAARHTNWASILIYTYVSINAPGDPYSGDEEATRWTSVMQMSKAGRTPATEHANVGGG